MKHERKTPIHDGDSGYRGDLVSELDRIQFNDRIAHLQRRARLQRRVIEMLARREDAAPLAELQAMILALEEIEERNLVLEDVIKTVREQIVGDRDGAGVLATLPQSKSTNERTSGVPASLIHEGRLEAERLRAKGNYKRARRVLRSVRCRRALAGSGLQMLAVSRYGFIRALFSFYKYRGTE
jgi:hypothetical protein